MNLLDKFELKGGIRSIIFLILGGGAIATLMIFAGLHSQEKDKVQLKDLSFAKGTLTEFYLDYSRGTKYLALTIKGDNQIFGIYRPRQHYENILNNIKIGDTVSIYYMRDMTNKDKFDSGIYFTADIYQLVVNVKVIFG